MGKNKKKQIKRASDHSIKKTHEPTAMELAFRNAEVQRKKDDTATEVIQGNKPPIPKHPETSKPLESIKVASQSNTTSVKPVSAKSVSAPSPASSNKNAPIAPQLTQKKATMPKGASPVLKNPTPVEMGLKPVPDKTLVLENVYTHIEDAKSGQGKNLKQEISSTWKTQVHTGNYKDESDIVIGFDFGTSSSKVIIQDSILKIAYAIPFGQLDKRLACSGNNYLIPTKIFINEDGSISLCGGDHSYEHLKNHLMDDPDRDIFKATNNSLSITVSEIAIAYMAKVIRLARDWFLKHTKKIYEKTHIHWHINLGIPSKDYDDLKRQKVFQTIAMAAWRVSSLNSKINLTDVKNILHEASEYINTDANNINAEEWLHPDYVSTHPEVIMEVVGYAKSPLRANGLYLLVDIGATTLDAATFRINSHDGEDVFALLETNVEKLGALRLHSQRIETMKNSMQQFLQQKNIINPIDPLPSCAYYEVKIDKEEVTKGDENFLQQCSKTIGEVVKKTKKDRDPHSSVWEDELPVFICGGGGRLPVYRKIINELGLRFKKRWSYFKGFTIKEIPKPEQLDAPDLPPNEYDRLAVAYGLSFTSDEIGEVIPKSKINNIIQQKVVSNIDDKYVTKDMC